MCCVLEQYFIFVLLFLLAELALIVLLFVFRGQVPVLARDLWTLLYNDAAAGIPLLISLEKSVRRRATRHTAPPPRQ